MRFMILRKADKDTEAGVMPTQELATAMMAYMEEMEKAGVLVSGEGLKPSAKGARVKFSGGRPTIVDGPFTESKELIAGFSVIDVKSKEEAIEWVKRWPTLDGDGNVEIEIRPLYEIDDFGDAFTPEARETERRLRAAEKDRAAR